MYSCAGFVPSMLNMGMDDGHLFLKFYCHELEPHAFQCSRMNQIVLAFSQVGQFSKIVLRGNTATPARCHTKVLIHLTM